jgi:hypothetical protein
MADVDADIDRGYRGHKQNQSHARKPHLKTELKRRPAIEPVIGHRKLDHRMGRNDLKGKAGDRFKVADDLLEKRQERPHFNARMSGFLAFCPFWTRRCYAVLSIKSDI